MVLDAIIASPDIDMSGVSIYTKGSYPNNTNVRKDSDVDVVVERTDCIYYKYSHGLQPAVEPGSYSGKWSPSSWRTAVSAALKSAFNADSVDESGKIAINIKAVSGSRPSADVVPSFTYHRYDDPHNTTTHIGSCVFPRDSVVHVINWPQQQLDNGRSLNEETGGRYKNFVRALKNAENTLAASGVIKNLPSYFMECLVYNVPAATLSSGSDLEKGFRSTLYNIWSRLDDGSAYEEMVEPNYMKWLFLDNKKWSVDDGKSLAVETYNYLGYGS
jgi:hypothetical protein